MNYWDKDSSQILDLCATNSTRPSANTLKTIFHKETKIDTPYCHTDAVLVIKIMTLSYQNPAMNELTHICQYFSKKLEIMHNKINLFPWKGGGQGSVENSA